jgi:ATP synthase protein I
VEDQAKKQAKRVIFIQACVVVIAALLAFFFISFQVAYSAILGGLATIVPAFIFMYFAFLHKGAREATRILRDFYLGIFFKFLSMAILFYLFFIFLHPNGLIFMLSFVITQILALIAPGLLSFFQRRGMA